MDAQIVVGVLALLGVLATQVLLHQRWARDQDEKRDHVIAEQAAARRREAADQANERREETKELIEGALRIAERNSDDAEKARLLALETAQAHAECRQEVAHLAGKVEELRARISETERTTGHELAAVQWHRDRAHAYLQALTVSEGYASMLQALLPKCTCHAFDPLETLTETFRPQIDGFLEEARRHAVTNRPEET